MKSFIAAMALVVFPFSAYSQQYMNKQVVCDTPSVVINSLKKDYGETLFWKSKTDDDTLMVIVANMTTQTWTLIEMNKETACVLSSGKGLPLST